MGEELRITEKEPVEKITSAKQLFGSLGFELNPEDKRLKDRRYEKPFTTTSGKVGKLTFYTSDVYYNPPEGEARYQNERYSLYFVTEDDMGMGKRIDIDDILEKASQHVKGGIYRETHNALDFNKQDLKDGGYNLIHELLSEALESEGTLTDRISNMLSSK